MKLDGTQLEVWPEPSVPRGRRGYAPSSACTLAGQSVDPNLWIDEFSAANGKLDPTNLASPRLSTIIGQYSLHWQIKNGPIADLCRFERQTEGNQG